MSHGITSALVTTTLLGEYELFPGEKWAHLYGADSKFNMMSLCDENVFFSTGTLWASSCSRTELSLFQTLYTALGGVLKPNVICATNSRAPPLFGPVANSLLTT